MKKARVILTGILLFYSMSTLPADTFRVRSLSLASIDSQKTEVQTVELGYNDAVAITFPKNITFLKGVEIEIKIPQDILAFRNSMAYGVYRQIQPVPSEKIIDYQGEQVTLQSLPSRLSFVLQIPFQKTHGLKTGPYSTVLPYVYDASKGPLLFRLLPVMKGLPENIETIQFSVKIRPILTDEGGFQLKLAYPSDEIKPVSIRIDEMLVPNHEKTTILSPGVHHLSIVSDDYRNEVRMFTIESARVTELVVPMQDTTPKLFLAAPENSRIYVDAELVENNRESREILPGEHTIRFMIGDYELTKQITVEKGRDYTVSMIIDISVTESP